MHKIYETNKGTKALAFPVLADGMTDLRRHWQLSVLVGIGYGKGAVPLSTICKPKEA